MFFIIFLFYLTPFCINSYETIIIETDFGLVRGYSNGISWQFLGIPYAQPPVNQLRWADPQPPINLPNIIDAGNYPSGCPQDCVLPPGACPQSVSEDCLYLNVYTPLSWKKIELYDVLIFLHGGSFISGSAGCDLYDGRFLANYTDTVIVTINYRLGALGFLYIEDTAIDGNLGIKDQRLAFEWVNQYISSFGGDKSSVSLFGQSAGAISIGVHLVSPQSMGLYTSVIIQSNPWKIPLKTVEEAKIMGSKFLMTIDCKGSNIQIISCLRGKTWIAIIQAQKAIYKGISLKQLENILSLLLQWGPIIDGVQIKDHPAKLLSQGKFAKVPIIMGTTSEEGLFFTDSVISSFVSNVEFDLFLTGSFGIDSISSIKKLYSIPKDHEDYRTYISKIVGDFLFYCPTYNLSRSIAKLHDYEFGGMLNIWLYVWDHPASFHAWGPRYPFCEMHACHGIELPFIFSTASLEGDEYSTDEYSIVRRMQLYWSNMAKYSDPTGFVPGNWPSFVKHSDILFVPSSNFTLVNDYRTMFCKFWDSYRHS